MLYKNNPNRREFIKKGSICLGLGSLGLTPQIHVKKNFTLRVLGTHVTLQEELRQQAMKDLGINVIFEPGGSAAVLHKALTRPESFDLYEQWSNSIRVLWQGGAVQAIDTKRIRFWDNVNALTKEGKLTDQAKYGAGDAPYKLLWVQKNGQLGKEETNNVSFLPYVHNTDSIGYNSNIIPKGIPYETESWSWLLDEKYTGKVAIINAPTIGLFDLVLAAQSKGLMKFTDIGNLSRTELDSLFNILIEYKKNGHFRGVWASVPQSVEFMERDGVVVESMFSPGVSALNGKGIPCIYAAPKEGYRAWHGVMCLSSKTNGPAKDAAYEYMNWWLSGWPGAFIARQGYYISTPQLSKPHMSKAEWDYWYEGKAATENLKNTQGEIAVKTGEVRTGGSYEKRFSNVAVWNTVMDTYEYSLIKWREFLLA
ncbi:MAG: extracellular solute-binding protein [Lentisphaeraceae bacterium]|nr:extracellular solute-binding protein [Lentisphaeraceae bacterium]